MLNVYEFRAIYRSKFLYALMHFHIIHNSTLFTKMIDEFLKPRGIMYISIQIQA